MAGAERIAALLARDAAGGAVQVRGWLRSARHGKDVSFLDLTDGSCLSGIQVVADPTLPHYEDTIKHLRTGCAAGGLDISWVPDLKTLQCTAGFRFPESGCPGML